MGMLSAAAGWLLGSAFWFGWHEGRRREAQLMDAIGHPPFVWPLYPVYILGFALGRKYEEREQAPKRMKARLLQGENERAQQQFPTWTTIGGSSGTNTP